MSNSISHCSSLIDFYLEQYRDGQDDEAFHGLLELDNCCLPDLVTAFRLSTDSSIRVLLLEVIWQHRDPTQIPLLGGLLFDDDEEIWQEAMDGLVTLACSASLQGLHQARTRTLEDVRAQNKFQKWLEEAISQTEAQLNS